jgi:hypothetical protein
VRGLDVPAAAPPHAAPRPGPGGHAGRGPRRVAGPRDAVARPSAPAAADDGALAAPRDAGPGPGPGDPWPALPARPTPAADAAPASLELALARANRLAREQAAV